MQQGTLQETTQQEANMTNVSATNTMLVRGILNSPASCLKEQLSKASFLGFQKSYVSDTRK